MVGRDISYFESVDMMINSVSNNLTALLNYGKDMSKVADRVSKGFEKDSGVDIATEFGKSVFIQNGHSANVKVIQTEDEMVGSVLDIIA